MKKFQFDSAATPSAAKTSAKFGEAINSNASLRASYNPAFHSNSPVVATNNMAPAANSNFHANNVGYQAANANFHANNVGVACSLATAQSMMLPQKYVPKAVDTKPRMPEKIYFVFKIMHDRVLTFVKAGALCMCTDGEKAELALVGYIEHDLKIVMQKHPKGVAYANQQYRELVSSQRALKPEEDEDFEVTRRMLLEDQLIFTQHDRERDLPDVIVVKDLDADYKKDVWMPEFMGPNELEYNKELGDSFLSPVNPPTLYHVMTRNIGDSHPATQRAIYSPVFTYYIDFTEQYVGESVQNPSPFDEVFES